MKVWMPYIKGGSGTDTWTLAMEKCLQKLGIDVFKQPFHHRFEFAPILLSRLNAPDNTDIVITNTWNGFAFRRPNTRLITVEHLCIFDPVLTPYKSIAQKLYHRSLIQGFVNASLHAADAVVAVSRYTARVMASVYQMTEPQAIVNGIDTDFFSPVELSFKTETNSPVRLLFVGNPSRRKGADLLLPIMERLGTGFKLYYTAGLRDDVLADARTDNMFPLGRLNQSEVRTEYRAADVLLFPSRAEGLPLCVIESLSCGTPVVAANVSSLPEVITSEVGRLCPVDDVDAFANAVRDIAAKPESLHAMSVAARRHAEHKFDVHRMVDEYAALFEQLVS